MEPRQKYDIFISYRREGGDKYARTIQQALEKQYRVFLDFDELKDGVFDQRIIDAISESPVFLLILSRGALDRCVNEDDWVRQEFLQAVKCGCHIVPVTIDDTFDGIPDSLPEELRNAVGQHQFSELQMKTLFKASMEQLVRDRIAPYVHREDANSGIEVHIDVDADCDLFRFKTFVRHMKANEDNLIYMNPGKYKLDFVSSLIADVKSSIVYTLAPGISCDFIEVSLKKDVEEAIAKREAIEKSSQVIMQREKDLHCVKRSGKYGFANENGNIVIPCKWSGGADGFYEGLARVQDGNWKWGFIDKIGLIVIPCKWSGAWHFHEGLARVKDTNKKFGYIDKTGTLVIPCKWERASDFSEGLACVRDNNMKYGFIDNSGAIFIPCKWEQAGDFSEGLASIQDTSGMQGFIDKTGTLVIPCKWKSVYPFSEGLACVRDENGKQGYIDKTGAPAIPFKWKNAFPFSKGIARVQDDDWKEYCIDKTGKVIREAKF